MIPHSAYKRFCEQRREAQQLRTLQDTQNLSDGSIIQDGRELISFASNDYLGLSKHPHLIARAQDFVAKYGTGSTASRLITGNAPAYKEIETRLAEGKGSEAALVFSSGYQANLTVMAALGDTNVIGKPVTILADRLCHNSLLQGILLSDARLVRFQHNDYDHLNDLLQLQREKKTHCIIVSESVFGMDGDCADLQALVTLADNYQAMLYIDEAHATGLFGPDGFGLTAEYKNQIDIVMGTFGKALGSFGAYIACSTILRDYLIQRCGGLIYTTALPPPVLGAIGAALELLPRLQNERAHVQQQSERLRAALRHQGWDVGLSATQIIPIILGTEQAATSLTEALREQGLFVPAIRPPTVPRGTSRLRLSLSAAHKASDIDHLIMVMAQQAEQLLKAA